MRRTPVLAAALAFLAALMAAPPARAGDRGASAWADVAARRICADLGDPAWKQPPPSPVHRIEAWAPGEPGEVRDVYLDTGPHVIAPGQDLSRLDFHVVPAPGFILETRMFVMDATDGSLVNGHEVHTHHAHVVAVYPENEEGYRWIYGTGEEMTGGSVDARAKADPRYRKGLRYGMFVDQGDVLGVLAMLHNKTSAPRTVYLRVWSRVVLGTREEIKSATGQDFHTLEPAIFGGTFNVPRTGGTYVWPADLGKVPDTPENRGERTAIPGETSMQEGTGVVWESPWTGQIVVSGGHLHAGGVEAYIANLGSEERPCPNTDGDRLAGTTLFRSAVFERDGVFPSEDYQMGLTQNGWRAWVRKGDRLAVNAAYLAKAFAYPDAMVFFGIFVDTAAVPPKNAGCAPSLIGKPKASHREVTRSVPNHPWSMYPEQHVCHAGHCDRPEDPPAPGERASVVQIADFAYLPGQAGMSGPMGPPVVARGDTLRFVNLDYAAGAVRHSVTTCRAPCNGPAAANYPFPDGRIESGPMGPTWDETYVTVQEVPAWELSTEDLEPGYYPYYCRLHPFMRGGFYVVGSEAPYRVA